jgi:tripartite-type tricarboxylate transporter receptor subunit TctC
MSKFRWLSNRRQWVFGLVLVLMLALAAACGGDATNTPTQGGGTTATPTATTSGGSGTATPTATTGAGDPTATPTGEPFDFSGRTINITVGYAPGGGFDTFARVMGAHMQQHLPGNPTVVVQNVPGADSLVAARQIANDPPRQGEIKMVNFISSLALDMALGNVEGMSPDDFTYIGVPDRVETDQMLCGRASVISSLDEMLTSGDTYTAAGLGGISNYDINLKAARAMGLPLDIVFGYGGTSEMIAAFNRGEVDTTPSCRDADVNLNPHWLEENYIVPLLIFDRVPDWLEAAQAEGKWTDVGNILEFNPDADPNIKQAVEANRDLSRATRVYAVHPDTPDDVVAALRSAMEQIVNSPEFVADMEERGYPAGFMSGDDYEALLRSVLEMPEPALNELKALLQPE